MVFRGLARVFSFSENSVHPSSSERRFLELERLQPTERFKAEMAKWEKVEDWRSRVTHETPRVRLPELMPDIFKFIQHNGWHRKGEEYRWFNISRDESLIDGLDPETVEVSLKIFDRPNIGSALQMELYEEGADCSTFERHISLGALDDTTISILPLTDLDVALILALPGAIEEQTA